MCFLINYWKYNCVFSRRASKLYFLLLQSIKRTYLECPTGIKMPTAQKCLIPSGTFVPIFLSSFRELIEKKFKLILVSTSISNAWLKFHDLNLKKKPLVTNGLTSSMETYPDAFIYIQKQDNFVTRNGRGRKIIVFKVFGQ